MRAAWQAAPGIFLHFLISGVREEGGGSSHLGRFEDSREDSLWASETLVWGLKDFASETFQQNQEEPCPDFLGGKEVHGMDWKEREPSRSQLCSGTWSLILQGWGSGFACVGEGSPTP